jgi:hypothetical protein
MGDIQLWVEDEGKEGLVPAAVRSAVRMQTVQDYTELINYLRPYATGVMGEVSPKLTEIYVAVLRQRGLLVGAYTHPPAREPEVKPEVIESTAEDSLLLGAKVLSALDDLEAQLRKDGKY